MSNISFEDLMESYNKLNNIEKKFLNNNKYSDYKIIENINLVDVKINVVNRTWKERLFTLPWKPWIKIRVIKKVIPKDAVYIINNCGDYGLEKVLVCHPAMTERLKKSLWNPEEL